MEPLARVVVRLRYTVILAWLGTGILAVPRAARVGDVLSVEGQPIKPTEAAEARELIHAAFERPLAKLLVVTVSGPMSIDSRPFRDVLLALTEAAAQEPYVDRVVSYLDEQDSSFVSRAGRETFFVATVGPEHAAGLAAQVPAFRNALAQAVANHSAAVHFEVHVTGEPALEWDTRVASVADARALERVALVPAALVLVLAFGALVAAALPIVVGLYAITCALAAVYVAGAYLPMAVFVLPIVTMVGLGVGIDYSLLLVTRFREELSSGLGPKDAAVRSTTTAGKAVVVSGLSVMIGFGALLLTPASETRSVGIGGLFVVAAAVMLSTTLLPAVLAVLGPHVDRPRWLARRLTTIHQRSLWSRWSGLITRHRGPALFGGLVILAVLTWPLSRLQIGIPRQGWFPAGTESALGADALERIGARGAALPVRVVVQAPEGRRIVGVRYLPGLKRLSDSILADGRVAQVNGPVSLRPGASLLEYAMLYGDLKLARERHPEAMEAHVSREGRTALMDVILTDSATVATGMEVVRRIRGMAKGGVAGLDEVDVSVGGFAAAQVDEETDLRAAFPRMIALVLGVIGLTLLIAFRSLLVPVKAVVMNVLSVAAAVGLLVFVFQEGLGSSLFGLDGPTEKTFIHVLVLVFAVAFGLSMDYEVFLLSRMKEAFDRTGDNDAATGEGLSATAGVITSAAAIMVIVFGTFAFSRILIAQLLGFGLAIAVLVDATVIRIVLVPAFMHVVGEWNWWPGKRRER